MPNPFDNLPDDALLQRRHLVSTKAKPGIVPFGSTTLWLRVKNGQFPKPVRIEVGQSTVWRVGDVREWLRTQAGNAA